MSHLKSLLVFGVLLLAPLFVAAQESGSTCELKRAMLDNTQISTSYYQAENICWISVHPNNTFGTLIYRDYMFGNEGLLFVFNSYGEGPNSTSTGAREFYIFPRKQYPSFQVDEANNQVHVTTASGEVVSFDAATTRVAKMTESSFKESPKISDSNEGGFEILTHNKVVLDCGFTLGNSPSANPKRTCKFTDATNQSCSVKAGEVFKYTSDGDNDLAFQDDAALAQFLSQRCKNLDLSPLQK